MSTTQVTIGVIVEQTGFTKEQVVYRLKLMGIEGYKVRENISLYDQSVIKKITDFVLPSDKEKE